MSKNKFIDTDRMKAIMDREAVDILVALSPENVLYSSGVDIITQRMIPERLALTVFTQKHDPIIIVCSIEDSLVEENSWISNMRTYTEFKESPVEALVDVIKELGFSNPTIAIETKYLRSEEHTSELQSRGHLVCRLLLEKK